MAPPTRHSTRLGANHQASASLTLKKEDENAGVNLSKLPTRNLRGRRDTGLATSAKTQLSTAKTAGTLLTTTANVRKRILDDRTNNVKPAPINSTSAATTKPIIKQIPTARRAAVRKPTDSAMVLEDLAVNEPTVKSRPIKPLKRNTAEPAPRRAAVVAGKKKATSADPRPAPTRSSVLVKVASTNGISGTQRATRRASGRGVLEAKAEFEDGRAAKKPRTSEPNELEKENADLKAEDEEVEEELAGPASKPAKPTINSESRPAELKEGEEGWEDLDEGDEDDPLMVKEYVNEIYTYMRELELETLPASDYMSRQNELTWKMRGVLVDWIIEVHSKFRLLPETLFLAINLMDRFLTKRTVALIKFQLVGVTALFLAAKYEEVICPSVSNFLYMTDGGYDSDEILKAETYMLEMLEWDLRYPNPLNFLRRVSKADQYDIQSRTFAKYFMEISIVDYRLVATPPSLLAAASIWLARKLLKRGSWDANLVHYSGYNESEILVTAQLMVDYILRSGCKGLGMGLEPTFVGVVGYEGGNEHGNLFKKYATRKFFRVSEIVRDWAVERYTFESPTGWEWDKLEEWGEHNGGRARTDEGEEEEDEEEE